LAVDARLCYVCGVVLSPAYVNTSLYVNTSKQAVATVMNHHTVLATTIAVSCLGMLQPLLICAANVN
jgi:hypothetical protein